ncbi:TPA: hypothetical protein N0F65_006788 [Lagenidium giganteum]|uniref:Uncharacterized protein n=1 Tax=Lagenidium giganteum TaxID=4803 RepID=A0AAV2ZC74_9STRA|nr:TPA: hypothetical protein N0F65_006788 [Lagenidium giganteum]
MTTSSPPARPQLQHNGGGADPAHVIDVSSTSPALMIDMADDDDNGDGDGGDTARAMGEAQRQRAGKRNGPAARKDADEDDPEEDDEDDSDAEYDSEHTYRRGRHAVPMDSPGDQLEADIVMEERTARPSRAGRSLRNHVFFQSDDAPRRYRSNGQSLRRIIFRRRRRGEQGKQEDDTFWTGLLIANLLSLAVLGCLVMYLTQTDFFASHQDDLFGSTVDNRFTVISQQGSQARIYLKSGYSNSRYSEAMIALARGELRLGRRALSQTDEQKFYGLSLLNNGTAVFTNKMVAPTIATDYLHAGNAVIFADGTTMTTAANMTGGISESGDLNLVSKVGSVVASAGNKQVLVIKPEGTVLVANAAAEDPSATGILLDGANRRIQLATSFSMQQRSNFSVIGTDDMPLRLNTSRIELGATDDERVVITCPTPDDKDDVDLSEGTALEFRGQTSPKLQQGGDVVIRGGDGTRRGGDIVIQGGNSTSKRPKAGTVSINADMGPNATSQTVIGSNGAKHKVSIHGDVSISGGNEGNIEMAGAVLDMSATHTKIINSGANSSFTVEAGDILMGKTSDSFQIGDLGHTAVDVRGRNVSIDSNGSLALGGSSLGLTIGNEGENSSTSIFGTVRFSSKGENEDLAIVGGRLSSKSGSISLGDVTTTDRITMTAKKISFNIAGANGILDVAADAVRLGSDATQTVLKGRTTNIDAADKVSIGGTAESVELGGPASDVQVTSKTVSLGKETTNQITLSVSNSTAAVFTGTGITIGASSPSITIGSANTAVNIQGKVTVNGKAIGSRRLESEAAVVYGGMDAIHFSVVTTSSTDEFAVPFQETFASSDSDFAFQRENGVFQFQSETSGERAMALSLSLDSLRLQIGDDSASTARIRCRVYRSRRHEDVAARRSILEASGAVDVCHGSACDDDLFFGLNAQRIVRLQKGDELSVRCTVRGSTSVARLLGNNCQISVREL